MAHDSIAAIKDREAYERALESMPEDLRGQCECVATQTQSQSQIVDELHIGKRTIRKKVREPYERITDYELGEMPEPLPSEASDVPNEAFEDIPF